MTDSHIEWILTLSDLARIDTSSAKPVTSTDDGTTNRIAGVVQSRHAGLVSHGIRLKVTQRTDLRVRWPIQEHRDFRMGQRVVAVIPIDAVSLEAGMFRRSQLRWNRWIGRIVLVEPSGSQTIYTVKLHGEDWTLTSYGPVVGARGPSRPWDVVNVVVDPRRVELVGSDGDTPAGRSGPWA
ncbi:MAG TPA: hypothetical protein VJ746_06615 [Nitrospira sp.]|nr:hypothetical protein [Nitrospira sp.]